MFVKTTTTIFAILALVLAGSAHAENDETQNPYAMADETWININGTVKSVTPDTFLLDYGQAAITVEMDDGDRDADAYKLFEGDKVSVSGFIDDDFFETTTIEASTVYVEKIGTTFYASGVDEEDWDYTVTTPVVISESIVTGKVTKVEDEEFVLDAGTRNVRVETDAMPYDPLDDIGYQKIRKGDRVQVTGRIDYDFLEGRELVADSVITLKKREEMPTSKMQSDKKSKVEKKDKNENENES